jgi:hypothetical protein
MARTFPDQLERARARVRDAAPELLEASKRATRFLLGRFGDRDDEAWGVISFLVSALAKAGLGDQSACEASDAAQVVGDKSREEQ